MKALFGVVLALCIGMFCRLSGIPVPAPPVLAGALLVVAMTAGFLVVDSLARHRPNVQLNNCGGPTGGGPGGSNS